MLKMEIKEIIQSMNDNKFLFIIVIAFLAGAWILGARGASIISIFNFIILIAILFKISPIVAVLHRVMPILVEHIRRGHSDGN